MARVASFTSAGTSASPRSTLAELMARKKMLAEQQGRIISSERPIESWTQGAAQLAQTAVNALQQRRAAEELSTGREQLAQTMSGIDWTTGPTPEQQATIYNLDPDLGLKLTADMIQARRNQVTTLTPEEEAAAGLPEAGVYQRSGSGAITRVETPETPETYGPVVTGEQAAALGLDATKSYQLNLKTQQYDQVGGGGTSVTINPPSAETSAKLGLAQGFLDNYDNILKSVDAGEMTGPGYLKGVTLGYGNGGAQYRNLLQGTEAMVRLLTGAGMNESEARQRVTQYEPAATDDAATLRSKVEGLKQALDNVIQGVQTRGQPAARDTAAQPDTTTPEAAPETYEVGKEYTFDDGSVATYKGGPVTDPKSWTVKKMPPPTGAK